MKISTEAKPNDAQSVTNEGNYSQEELDGMLEDFVKAKQIESDPKLFATLKSYAISRNKAIADLFSVNNAPAPKTLKDLKKTYDAKVAADQTDKADLSGEGE